MGQAEDRELLVAARRGDREAFSRLTRVLWDDLFADAYRVVRNLEGAEDAFLDGMAAGWRDVRSIDDPGQLETLLGDHVARAAEVEARRHSRLTVPGPELPIDIAPHLPDRLVDQLIERLRRQGQVPGWRMRLRGVLRREGV